MKKIIATAIASFAFIALAHAGEAEGVIQSMDTDAASITLDSGQTFTLGDSVEAEGLEVGAKVKVTFDDGSTEATAVEVMN